MHMTSAWPSWVSPIGWAGQVYPFAGERWWVFALPVVLVAGATALAFALASRRDVGLGMIAERRGPASAAASLLGPFGLAWRLQRGTWLPDDTWYVASAVQEGRYRRVADLIQEGVEAVGDETSGAGGRLAEMRDFFLFLQSELGGLLDKWHRVRR